LVNVFTEFNHPKKYSLNLVLIININKMSKYIVFGMIFYLMIFFPLRPNVTKICFPNFKKYRVLYYLLKLTLLKSIYWIYFY